MKQSSLRHDRYHRDVDDNVIGRWVWGGADRDKVDAVLRQLEISPGQRSEPAQYDTIMENGPRHWVCEFTQLGDQYVARGDTAESAGDVEAAPQALLQASNYYQIAKFPYIRSDEHPHYLAAYQNRMAADERAGKYLPAPLKVVEIPYGTKKIRGYLHLVAESSKGPAPLVIVSGGIDTFKAGHSPLVKKLRSAGMSALVVDLPGVGESSFLDATPDHDQVYSAFLDKVSDDPRVDGSRVGVWAASWGGNAAAKVAFTDDRFKAAASACGPIHEATAPPSRITRLAPNMLRREIPAVVIDVAADRVGLQVPLENSDMRDFGNRLRKFSSVNQGLVNGDVKATVPALAINTSDDGVASPEEREALAVSALHGEVYYTGPGGHSGSCVPVLEKSVSWVASQLVQ